MRFVNGVTKWATTYFVLQTTAIIICVLAVSKMRREWELSERAMWQYVATNELNLGDSVANGAPILPRALENEAAMLDNHMHGEWRNQFCWRHNLANLLQMLGMDAEGAILRSRSATRRVRLAAGRELLRHRDIIFDIRARVFNSLARETVRENNAMNRAIVNREVLNVIRSDDRLRDQASRTARLVELTVAACFIDTIYDEIGQEVAFGPPTRPL
jgi:hypothetical protein